MRRRSHSGLVLVLGAAAAVLILCSAGLATTAPGSDTQRLVILVRSTGQGGLDPLIQVGSSVDKFIEPLYEGLVVYDPGAKAYRASLAESWIVSPDGLQYTFKLRRGVRFHDGAMLTAEAVKGTYDRAKRINLGLAYLLTAVARTDVVDPVTVRIVLSQPTPFFLYTTFRIKIISPKAIKEHDLNGDLAQQWLVSNAAGTGPFQLVRWAPEQNDIVFKRFPGYWKPWRGPHLDTVVYNRVVEPATQRQLLERGDGDMIVDQVLPQDVPALRQNPALRLDIWTPARIEIITMRSDRGPLANRKLREALTYAFPYEQVLAALDGLAGPAQGPLPRSVPEHDDTLPIYKQDLTRARRLLAEAGYPTGGLSLNLVMVQALAVERIPAELFQSALAALNINVSIQELTFPAMVTKFRNETAATDMAFLVLDTAGPTPDRILYEGYHSDAIGKIYNWAWYTNVLLDKVLTEASTSIDPARRLALYRRAQRIIVGDAPAIFVLEPASIMARRTWVKGFKPNVMLPFAVNLEEIYIEGRGR
ncbi:MAG TPA: ABC transporter substrate-binding protein [bacterium]|nr:ABC transporter substrate-binding protein [bacterium]